MSEVGYLLDSGCHNRLWFRFRLGLGVKNPVQRNRLYGYGLLHEAEEELAAALGPAPIETERELIQVVVEMLLADRALVGSHQPPLEERDHSMDSRQQFQRGLLLAPQEGDLMRVAVLRRR